MVTLSDSLVSSSARKLPVRVRPDLSAKQQRYLGQMYWVVKEPIGLKYYRFQEEEYAILNMLDGEASLDEIKVEFEQRFPPQKITVEELGRFIGMLHKSSLVVANVAGQGKQLRKRHLEKKWQTAAGTFSNILAIRFKGVDPERLFDWLYPKVRWFFSVPALIICAIMASLALLLVAVQFDTFQNKLPTFHQFFEAKNWIYLGITLGVTKILHEFGHGLACKHFGGECHEMGVMLLVLTPCLFCNVSDSWMLPNKWHRAAIGAAGMYVEVCVASICTFLWWFSEPGLLNQICLSVMFVSSVSTILFNGNPLLRYDGYYILSDLMEIPNMRQKASSILSRKLGAWCLGLEEPDDPFLPQRNQFLFALYTVASSVYKWMILAGILFFLYKLFEPYGLKILSQMLAMVSFTSLVAMPLYKLGKFFYIPGRLHKVKRKNVNITLAVLTAVAAFVIFCPLPYRIICPLELKPRGAESVYVQVAGTLDEIAVEPGQQVAQGETMGRLSSIDVDLAIAELEAQIAQDTADRDRLRHAMFNNTDNLQAEAAVLALPALEESLASSRQQLVETLKNRERLELKAPIAGTVLPPRDQSPPPDSASMKLPTWSGSPLQRKNLGARLDPATVYCLVGDPHEWEASIIVEQDSIEYVQEGQQVAIKLDTLPNRTFEATIEDIGPEMEFSTGGVSSKHGGDVMTRVDETGRERPISTSYHALAALDDPSGTLVEGLRGSAKINAEWQPLGRRLWRYLMRTFNFRL